VIGSIAFWSLGDNGGVIDISNAQGCTQLVADIVDLDDVRFGRCSFDPTTPVPEPMTLSLLGIGAMALLRRRK